MRGRFGALLLLALLIPAPALAWGAAAHRYAMGRAIALLPVDIRPFFEQHRNELLVRVNDPDTWRVVGWADNPNHFLDLGLPEFGPFPFGALPRERGAAVAAFGMVGLQRIGMLPWREEEEFGNLRRAFEGFRRKAAFAAGDTVLFAAVAAHYLQDAYQPLHATSNYDGQATGQVGVHARFETTLFERYQARLVVRPVAVPPLADARDAAFDTLLGSYQLVDRLLVADKEAAAGSATYDHAYYERFFARVRPLLEERLGGCIAATAALIAGAWEQAGHPTLGPEAPPAAGRGRP